MNMITTTALANFRKNKSRNILVGIAIGLTTFLLTAVPTMITGQIGLQFRAVNELYTPFHGMYRNVGDVAAKEMLKDKTFEKAGVREDPAYIYCEGKRSSVNMTAMDPVVAELSKIKLEKGRLPEKAHEIVVSKGLLKYMGLDGDVGDQLILPFQPVKSDGSGLGELMQKEFTVTGLTEDTRQALEQDIYTAIVSEAFAEEIVPEGKHNYRVYFQLADVEGRTTEGIEQRIEQIGGDYGVKKQDIVENTEYLMANYVDPALYSGMAAIMAMIVLAGVLTIYSVYYVSMLDKVQEYGRLRAIGATRRQIRKIVFREGLAVAAAAIPAGLIAGTAAGILLIQEVLRYGMSTDNFLAEQMKALMEQGEGHIIKLWVIALAAVISIVTVYLSLLGPMRTASRISPVEAIRYQGRQKKKDRKQSRRGYESMSIGRLTVSNLGRNQKRTVITIVTLGITGILFVVTATVCSSMDPAVRAREEVRGDIEVGIAAESGNEMHPERELQAIQQNNPMTDDLREQISGLKGVIRVDTVYETSMKFADMKDNEENDGLEIRGLSEAAMEELKDYVLEGDIDAESVRKGSGIIVSSRMRALFPQLSLEAGKKISLLIQDGDRMTEKEFEIAAVADAPVSFMYCIAMPGQSLQEYCETDITDRWDIMVEDGKEQEVAEKVSDLITDQEFLEMDTYQERYKRAETDIGYIVYACYGLLFVFGLIGILNLINTIINSVHVRRKELGMLQAIGMSGRQTVRMLQMEGLVYTAGTFLLSVGVGSVAGYGLFLWAKEEGFMSVRTYHYPVLPVAVLTCLMITVQLLITYLVNQNFKKQSLIDRIRFAE